MLLDFQKVHQIPHDSLIVKNTAYVIRDVDEGRAVIYFSTKDEGDPDLFRTVSMADIYQAISEAAISRNDVSLVSYPTKAAYTSNPPSVNAFVFIRDDEDEGNVSTTNLFLADDSELFRMDGGSNTSGGTEWQSTEW